MRFMSHLVSAFVVFACVSWNKCQASSLVVDQSENRTSNDVTRNHDVTNSHDLHKSEQSLQLKVTQPEYISETSKINITNTNRQNVSQNSTTVTPVTSYDDHVISFSKPIQEVTETDVSIYDVSTIKEPISEATTIEGIYDTTSVTETVSQFTETDDLTSDVTGFSEVSATDEPLHDVSDDLSSSSFTTTAQISENTETISQETPVTEFSPTETTESTDLFRDGTEPSTQNTDMTEFQSKSFRNIEYTTRALDDVTGFTEFVDSSSREPENFDENTYSTVGERNAGITVTLTYSLETTTNSENTDETQQTAEASEVTESFIHFHKPTQVENSTNRSNTSKENPLTDITKDSSNDSLDYWNSLTETNQILEDDSIIPTSKKRWKGRRGKKGILDEMGFVVSDPEEEKYDEEDDLKIFEAVVTSMAQWELKNMQKKLNSTKKRVKRDEEVVCYKDLGCFRDEGPFDYLDMLPSPPEEINTRFLLFTRERPDREKVLRYQNVSTILDSHFNTSRPTKMLIHGFGSSCYSLWIREMREALLTMMDVNIICVNWQKGAEVPNYVRAASNTRLVGRQVAVFIETMNAFLNTTLDDFHLIGFSLGAHVSGHAGARLKNLSRISGLDPAGPLFESYSPSVRLDEGDAKFVDVIHTNADSLLMGGLGAFEPMGHVDFYPNGGRMQKGCANLFVGGVSDILWPTEGDGRYLCNHRRGYQYYLNSVAPICKFPAFVCRDYETFLQGNCFPCKSCGNMGYFSDKAEGRGQLYLVTRDTEPFCANQYKVTVKHSGGPPADPVTSYGRIDVTFIAADGLNETLPLTQSDDMAMEAGSETVRIMVPHPAISEVVSIQLRYLAYQGWIYSGFARWAIDKISLMDSFGKTLSFCNRGTTLISGQVMQFNLLPGDCTVREAPVAHNNNNNVQQYLDSSPEESENEVRQAAPLQIALAPRLEPRQNLTKAPQGPVNLTHPIPPPMLGPIDAHTSILSPPQGPAAISLTLEHPQHHKEAPPNLYDISAHRYHPLLHPFPPNHPNPMRYGNEPGGTATPSTPILHLSDKDVAVSSEEPVSVIPAPDLASVPRPLDASHLKFVTQRYRPEEIKVPANIPFTPFSASTVSIENQKTITNQPPVHRTPPNLSAFENQQLPFHTTRSEFINATTIRVVTSNQDVTEKNIFDNTFSPRTSSVVHEDHISDEFTTTPLPPDADYQSSRPNPFSVSPSVTSTIITVSPRSTTPKAPLEQLSFESVQTQQTEYLIESDRKDSFPELTGHPEGYFLHPFRPPPPTPKLHRSQSGLTGNRPMIVDSNSLIDGEIPEKERARSLTLDTIPNNSLPSEQSSETKNKTKCGDTSPCPTFITFTTSDRTPVAQDAQGWHSTSLSEVPPYSSNPRPHFLISAHSIRQENPQRHFPTRADAPPRRHSSYVTTNFDDALALASEASIRPDATSAKSSHGPSSDSDSRRSNLSPILSGRLPFTHNPNIEPNSQIRHHNSNLDSPRLPPLLLNPPPLETIVGHGRAPQPSSSPYPHDSWPQNFSLREQHALEHQTHKDEKGKHDQVSFMSVHPHLPIHQDQHHRIGSQHNSPPENERQLPLSVSVGNESGMNSDGTVKSPPQAPPPAPFYVQILPPNFGSLPHLETFSLPRDNRKAQESLHGKRSGLTGRANRGRSLAGSAVPPPGGRGAVFKPLLLQFQDNRHGRYIPLRPPPEAPRRT